MKIRKPTSGGKAGKGKNETSSLQVVKDSPGGYQVLKQYRYKVGDRESYLKAKEKALGFIRDNGPDEDKIGKINERLKKRGYPFRLAYTARNNKAFLGFDSVDSFDFDALLSQVADDLQLRGLGNFLHDERLRGGNNEFASKGFGMFFVYSFSRRRSVAVAEDLDLLWDGSPPEFRKLNGVPPLIMSKNDNPVKK